MARCSLCGGRLNGNICTECGLDNSKSDFKYNTHKTEDEKLNSPLTHSHRDDRPDPLAGKTTTKKQEKQIKKNYSEVFDKLDTSRRPSQRSPEPDRRKILSVVISVITVLMMIGSLLGFVEESVSFESFDEPVYEADDSEVWNFLQNTLEGTIDEDGNYYETILTSGCYKVGVHIPEGVYSVHCDGDYSNFSVSYPPEDVNDLSGVLWDEDYCEGLNLCTGMRIAIDGNAKLIFETFNSQDNLNTIDTPLYEPISLGGYKDSLITYMAGDEFRPGVYDLYTTGSNGSGVFVEYSIEDVYYSQYYYFGPEEEGFTGTIYNIVLPEGAVLELDNIKDLTMIPSPFIESTDYASFYR